VARWIVELTDAAERELRSLPGDIKARFLHVAEMLEEAGPANVGMPHVRFLEGKLWEMRLRGRDGIARAIYFASAGRKLTVVRVFAKKTQATPRREIDLALKRMSEGETR
jgi:phage-related protein